MAILPRYQRIGLKTRQPQQMDFAASREQAKLGQNISQQINRMSDFAFREASEQATIRGQERVRDDGARPTLAAIEEAGGPSTISQKAAYALGSRVAVSEIQNEAEVEMQRILSEAERNVTPFTQVQSQLADIKDGYAASLDTIDPEAAMMLSTRLEGATGKAEGRYSNWYIKKQASIALAKQATAADTQLEIILANAIVPGSTLKSIKSDILDSSKLLSGFGVSNAKLIAFRESALNAAIKENTIYKFNTSDLDSQKNILTEMETTPVQGMSLAQTQGLRKSLRADYNSKVTVLQGQARNVEVDVRAQAVILAKGGMPNEKQMYDLQSAADAAGDYGADAREAINQLRFQMDNAEAFRKMTPEDLAEQVQILSEGTPGLGLAGVDTLLEVDALNTAKAYLKSGKAALKAASTKRKVKYKPVIDALDSSIKDAQKLIDSGVGFVSEDTIVSITTAISKLPEDLRADLGQDAEALFITSQLSEQIKTGTPASVASLLRDLVGGTAGFGEAGIDTPLEQQTYDLAKKMLTNMETELKSDPLSYAMRVGVKDGQGNSIEITPIDFADPDATDETIKKRISDARTIAAKYSNPVQYFTPQETSMLAEVIEGSDKAQRMYFLGAIVDGGGIAAPQMLSEISKTSSEFAGIGALVLTNNQESARLALGGMDLTRAGYKAPEFTAKNTDIPFNRKTLGALKYTPNSMQIIREVASSIYTQMANSQGLEYFNEKMWNKAIDLAAGGKDVNGVLNGGIQDVRDQNTLIPSELSADEFEDALNGITPAAISFATGGQTINDTFFNGSASISEDSDYKAVKYPGGYILTYGDQNVGDPLTVRDVNGDILVIDMLKLHEEFTNRAPGPPARTVLEVAEDVISSTRTSADLISELEELGLSQDLWNDDIATFEMFKQYISDSDIAQRVSKRLKEFINSGVELDPDKSVWESLRTQVR